MFTSFTYDGSGLKKFTPQERDSISLMFTNLYNNSSIQSLLNGSNILKTVTIKYGKTSNGAIAITSGGGN